MLPFSFFRTQLESHHNQPNQNLTEPHVYDVDHIFATRSFCLTKNYCNNECFSADAAVHKVCCKNLLEVDKRKQVKKGGKAKMERADQKLDDYQRNSLNQHLLPREYAQTLTEVVSKMKKIRVKNEKRKEKVSEVD